MCRFMRVSRSAYYAWLQRPETSGEKEDAELTELNKTAFAFCQESGDLWDSPP
jgi:putative transposase